VAPVQLALDQERRVTEQINGLAALARQDGDYTSEQFLQWFLKEQVEEVATMSDLLTVVKRARDNPLLVEEYLAREGVGPGGGDRADDPTAPPVAGGAV
jgi:ferritin